MTNYLLIGLISGLIVFLSLFMFSFLTLGLITGMLRAIRFVFNDLILGKPTTYRAQRI